MDISRNCKITDINWATLPDLNARLERLGVSSKAVTARLFRYPDSITHSSLDDASRDAQKAGPPKRYMIDLRGELNSESFSLSIHLFNNIHGDDYLSVGVSGVKDTSILDSVIAFLGLTPDEPSILPPKPHRSAFIAHRFDQNGHECADKLARFLELLNFRVVTGRGYSPESVGAKVLKRIETQAVVFAILTQGDDQTWLIQESVIGSIKGKPLIILKEPSADYKEGILADHEYIQFNLINFEASFIPILEGLRELGYMNEAT